jgi:phosphoglycolate phosphatase-like HAD superfamily hydrolase
VYIHEAMHSLLLFDIDNTLLKTSTSHHRAFEIGISRVYGARGDVESINPHGMTDLGILEEVLRRSGVAAEEIAEKMDRCMGVIVSSFTELIREERLTAFEGVRELLEALEALPLLMGLVTGNLEPIAWEKLERTGLRRFFRFGGFGGEDRVRANLVKSAVRHARLLGYSPSDGPVILVGDTPRDVSAGREAGVCTVAVATGVYTEEELGRAGADAVLSSFRDTGDFLAVLRRLKNAFHQ